MKIATYFTTMALVLAGATTSAAVMDDFEGGGFDASWEDTSNATLTNDPGNAAGGSDNYAAVSVAPNPSVLGGYLNTSTTGVADFTIDMDFRIQASANRQFNFQVGVDPNSASTAGAATINLRYKGGNFDVFDGAWQELTALGSVAADQWHHIQIVGSGWGTAGASYDVTVTPNGGSAATVTGVTTFQTGDPTANLASGFNVNAAFGSNPGFDVDNVNAVPEPSSLALLGLGGLLIARRRRS